MSEVSSTVSSCHRARRSISKSTKRSCGFCFAHCARSDESCGRTNHGCFTTTVHLSIRQFLAEKNLAVLEEPPYSPDLAPCAFFLFPKLKEIIKGTCFEGVEAIKRAVTTELRGMPEESFQKCIEAWQRMIEKCIRLEGGYFEGETM